MDFQKILDFIVEYRNELCSVFIVIFTIVVNIIKKRPSYSGVDIKEDVLEILPALLIKVEENGNGQQKKNAVLDLIKAYVQGKYHCELSEELCGFFSRSIESILSTPQKKVR